MKLKAAQLAKLPDSEFGLIVDGKRSYPLVDKNHVIKAIQFFKHCPDGKKKELASNINKKAKEFDMKIHAKGEFMKYIDPEVMSLSKEASNVGTLEPIVGGEVSTQKIHIPALEDDVSDNYKALGGIARGEMVNKVEEVTEGFSPFTWDTQLPFRDWLCRKNESMGHDAGSYYTDPRERIDYNKPVKYFEDFDEYLHRVIVHKEIEDFAMYMTSWTARSDSPFYSNTEINVSNIRKKIFDIMRDESLGTALKVQAIRDLISTTTDKERLLYYLRTVDQMDSSKRMVKAILVGLLDDTFTIMNHSIGKHLDLSKIGINANYAPPSTKNMENDIEKCELWSYKIDGFIYTINYGLLTYHEKKYGWHQYMKEWLDKEMVAFLMYHMLKARQIYGYCVLDDASSSKATYIKFEKEGPVYRADFMYNDAHEIIMIAWNIEDARPDELAAGIWEREFSEVPELVDNYIETKIIHRDINLNQVLIQKEIAIEAVNFEKAARKANDFVKGLRISKDGDITINLKNKLTMDHWKEIHETLKINHSSNNIEAMKSNVAYTFSLIAIIENEYTFNKSYDKRSPEYEEILNVRAHLINDFKTYLKIVIKNEPGFNFLEYYKESGYDANVYTIDHNVIKGLGVVFRKAIGF